MTKQRLHDRLDVIQQAMGGCDECCDAAAGLWALDICCADRAAQRLPSLREGRRKHDASADEADKR